MGNYLTQNRELRADRIWCWTLPAWVRRVTADGHAQPPNVLFVYSLGGREDHLLDLDVDRHADVFPDLEALEAAGYYDQSANDLLAVVAPSNRIGIPANNIPAFKKRQGADTFGQMEANTRRHGR